MTRLWLLIFSSAVLQYPKLSLGSEPKPNYGVALFLTPFIENGKIVEGQKAAEVNPLKADVQSYSGFFTVDKKYNSSMFFWYFPAEKTPETAPVVLWLQGGPGASSLYGLFAEHGPFYVKPKRGLKMRDYYWSQVANMIYIDNPVGTGFSFTDNDAGYSKNQDDIGNNLYEALRQFFTLFPKLQKNDFYVTGESYAGKYVPSVALTIHNKNPGATMKINLKGIAIGNGLCDPPNMLKYGDYLYQIGLIDFNGRDQFKAKEKIISDLASSGKYLDAFKSFDELLNGDLTPWKTLFYNLTNFEFYFNYLHNEEYNPASSFKRYIDKDLFRRTVHVGILPFNEDIKVEMKLMSDIMQSVKPKIQTLIENYRVLIYNGQLDIIVAYPLTVNFLLNLQWSGAANYRTAQRKPWYVGSDLAGYSKTVKGFTELLVRDAGHMVPADQPLWALDMITRFVSNKPF